MKRRRGLYLGIVACVTLSLSNAAAQTTSRDKAIAIQLFEEAEQLMATANPAAACPKYSESQKREPQLGTLLQLADCHERIGKTASAWAAYKEAAEIAARRNAAGSNEPREAIARARAAALETKVARLMVIVTQADIASLEIRQDGELLGRGAWGSALPVDPGTSTITAQARGKKPWSKAVEIPSTGARIEVTIPPLEDEAATPTAVPAAITPASAPPGGTTPPTLPERSARGSTQRIVGYFVGGGGVIAIGVGAALGFVVNSRIAERDAICPSGQHCTPDEARQILELDAQARSNAVACNVALVLGTAAALGGVALVLTAPSGTSGSSGAGPLLRIGTWGGLHSAGASLQGSW